MTNQTMATLSLEQQLAQKWEATRANAPASVVDTIFDEVERLAKSNALAQALKAGDNAPDFTLPGVKGQPVNLVDLLQKGPVVLTFYRGDWCPYCNLTLRAYQQALPQMQELGATLVAISPQTPDNSLTTAEKRDLTFEVLSDVDNTVARQYKVVYRVGEDMQKVMTQLGSDLSKYNGNASWELPLTATFVIGQDSVIKLAFVDADYKKRLDPTKIIAALQQ